MAKLSQFPNFYQVVDDEGARAINIYAVTTKFYFEALVNILSLIFPVLIPGEGKKLT